MAKVEGTIIEDGKFLTLAIKRGELTRFVTGTVRSFEQDGETRWEISADEVDGKPGDPGHEPAIGFLPEHVLTARG